MRPSPSLLSLALDSALLHISHFCDLSPLPDPILVDLFLKTIQAGKLTEKVLRLFLDTGSEEILALVRSFNIRPVLTPVLPTSMTMLSSLLFSSLLFSSLLSFQFISSIFTFIYILFLHSTLPPHRVLRKILNHLSMSLPIQDCDIDIVIAALHPDLTPFLEAWRPFFSRFHIILVQDPDLHSQLQIPSGFDLRVYTKSDMAAAANSTSINFSGHSCRYFGYLISRKKYVISIDQDCLPAKDPSGILTDAVAQHITNLATPATPFFFNTLYDPFRPGADFVRGYPFSMRCGVPCALSCGLWLNIADYDALTQSVKPNERNTRYVDAVMTVPVGAMMPASGINIAFDRLALGPALLPGVHFTGEGKRRWETLEDIWSGLCAKVVCDHLGLGVKTGLPYVHREGDGSKPHGSLNQESEKVKLLDHALPFFQSVKISQNATTAVDCVTELAGLVREKLGAVSPVFATAANAMDEWVNLWKSLGAQAD